MFRSKPFTYALFIQVLVAYVAFGKQTFIASFQTDIKDNTLATADVWVEFSDRIPRSKEFTVCHWIKIKFYNSESAACLWSYCTVESPGQKMECLEVCMLAVHRTLNRNLFFNREIKLNRHGNVDVKRLKLK